MDGFEKRRNEKKKAIMQMALELFDQYGFDKVTCNGNCGQGTCLQSVDL